MQRFSQYHVRCFDENIFSQYVVESNKSKNDDIDNDIDNREQEQLYLMQPMRLTAQLDR